MNVVARAVVTVRPGFAVAMAGAALSIRTARGGAGAALRNGWV